MALTSMRSRPHRSPATMRASLIGWVTQARRCP